MFSIFCRIFSIDNTLSGFDRTIAVIATATLLFHRPISTLSYLFRHNFNGFESNSAFHVDQLKFSNQLLCTINVISIKCGGKIVGVVHVDHLMVSFGLAANAIKVLLVAQTARLFGASEFAIIGCMSARNNIPSPANQLVDPRSERVAIGRRTTTLYRQNHRNNEVGVENN